MADDPMAVVKIPRPRSGVFSRALVLAKCVRVSYNIVLEIASRGLVSAADRKHANMNT